jgi:hypothetical protein
MGQSVVVTQRSEGSSGAGTGTLATPERRAGAQVGRPSTVWTAFQAAAAAALAGLAVTAAVVLLGWGLSSSGTSTGGAVRLAAQCWLLAHHGRLQLPLGDVGLAPLGLTLLPVWLLYRAGSSVARTLSFDRAEHAAPATAAKAVLALAGTYAVLVVLGTGLASTETVQVEPVSTLIGAGLLATVAGGAGLLRGCPLTGRMLAPLPAGARHALRAAFVALGVLVGAGALVAGGALVSHHGRAAALSHALAPGLVDGTGLLLLGLLCVPNAAVWACGYAVGPGFAVGAGTSVTAFGTTLGPVPAFPLLAALPDGDHRGAVALLALGAPLLGGVLAGLLVGRRCDGGPLRAAGWAAAAGCAAGALLAMLAALAGGPLGSGRMSALGPSPWQVGLAAAVELAAVGAATAAARSPRSPARSPGSPARSPGSPARSPRSTARSPTRSPAAG